MNDFPSRFHNWQISREFEQAERDRVNFLNAPVPPNPPDLVRLVRVRVVRPFFVGGRRVEPSEIVELPKFEADSISATGKAVPI